MTNSSFRSKLLLWVRAIRPVAYPASFFPAAIGTLFAATKGYDVSVGLFFLVVAGVIFAHTGANLLSDYFDFKSGIDKRGTLGGSGVLVEKLLLPRDIFAASVIFFFAAAICAIAIYYISNFNIWPLVALGFIAGAFYSTPILGFKRSATGEFIVLASFGVGIALGAFAVQAKVYSFECFLLSLPVGLYVSAILLSNNLRDIDDDRAIKIRTLAVRMGKAGGLLFFAATIFFPFVIIAALAIFGVISAWTLLCFLTLPLAIKLYLNMKQGLCTSSEAVAPCLPQTAQLCMVFGFLLCLGLWISI